MPPNKPSKRIFGEEISVSSEPLVIILENSGDNGTVVFDSDDIEPKTLDKMSDYAAATTRQGGNFPYVKPNTDKITLQTPNGYPAPLSNDNNTNTTYTKILENESGESTTNDFKTASNANILNVKFTKGKVDDTSAPSAEQLIREVNRDLGKSTISKAIQIVLEENNRYSENNLYVNTSNENESNVGHLHLQNQKLGEYTPRKFPDVNSDDIQFKVKNLKNLGTQLLFKATGEIYVPEDTNRVGDVLKARAASLVPGQARIGIKVPVSRFSVAELASEISPNFKKQSNFPELGNDDSFSHGSFYNPLIPFDSLGSNTFTKPAAILLALTFSFLLKGMARLLGPSPIPSVPSSPAAFGSALGSDNTNPPTAAEKRRNRLGNYSSVKSEAGNPGDISSAFNSNFLMLTHTKADYTKAVEKGLDVFFGKGPSGVLGTLGATIGVGDTFSQVSDNPAYYNVILRFLVKTLVSTLGGVASTLGAIPKVDQFLSDKGLSTIMDVEKNIGLEQDPTNVLNTIKILRDSPIIKFLDILARLGDIYIEYDDLTQKNGSNFYDKIDSILDSTSDKPIYPNPAALIKKNRLSSKFDGTKYSDSMAWGADTLRSMYILPDQYVKAHEDFGSDGTGISIAATNKNFIKSSENRLTQEQVEELELELDSYYVPFYFHDLRTNEIIAFHAFLETVSDSYDADYNTSEGFGRIGKVFTYKNTNRKITLSFKFASVNKLDFSDMWYKINKLVMMMYPQYTEGRSLGTESAGGEGSRKFIQPFSQLIGSTPVIRIRVGDLIKTNYSDVDVARLFGLGTDKFSMNGATPTKTIAQTIANSKKIDELRNRHISYDFDLGDVFYIDGSTLNQTQGTVTGVRELPGGKIKASIKNKSGFKTYGIKIIEPSNDSNQQITINFGSIGAGVVTPDMDFIQNKVNPTKETKTDSEFEQSFGANEDIKKFFNPAGQDGNPIIKSFDSVKGEGLAGVITSMNFDWSESRWDTENGFNSKAPMFGKVDLSFEVIHDINPGLDSSGMMTGAPYNVGILMKALKANRNQKIRAAKENVASNNISKTKVK